MTDWCAGSRLRCLPSVEARRQPPPGCCLSRSTRPLGSDDSRSPRNCSSDSGSHTPAMRQQRARRLSLCSAVRPARNWWLRRGGRSRSRRSRPGSRRSPTRSGFSRPMSRLGRLERAGLIEETNRLRRDCVRVPSSLMGERTVDRPLRKTLKPVRESRGSLGRCRFAGCDVPNRNRRAYDAAAPPCERCDCATRDDDRTADPCGYADGVPHWSFHADPPFRSLTRSHRCRSGSR